MTRLGLPNNKAFLLNRCRASWHTKESWREQAQRRRRHPHDHKKIRNFTNRASHKGRNQLFELHTNNILKSVVKNILNKQKGRKYFFRRILDNKASAPNRGDKFPTMKHLRQIGAELRDTQKSHDDMNKLSDAEDPRMTTKARDFTDRASHA